MNFEIIGSKFYQGRLIHIIEAVRAGTVKEGHIELFDYSESLLFP